LLLFLHKTLFTVFGAMLLVSLFMLSAGQGLQAYGQAASAYVSSSTSEEPDSGQWILEINSNTSWSLRLALAA